MDQNFNEHDFNLKVIDILTEWINKLFNDSVLANFGLERSRNDLLKYKLFKSTATQAKSSIMSSLFSSFFSSQNGPETFQEIVLDEVTLYAILLRVNLSSNRGDNHYLISSILKNRLIESKNLEKILTAKATYNFKQLGVQEELISQIFDQVIVGDYMLKNPRHVETVCKVLMNKLPLLKRYTSLFFEQKLQKVKDKLSFVLVNDEFAILLDSHFSCLNQMNDSLIEPAWRNTFLIYFIGSLVTTANKLIEGTLEIETVQLIGKHVDAAFKILEIIKFYTRNSNDVCVSASVFFRQVVKERMREVEAFKSYQQNLTSFIQICSKLKGENYSLR
jgi:hypothetical protein